MQKYHTLFVSMSGNVWGCGIGQGGRLGPPSEDIVIIPELVSLRTPSAVHDMFCIMAAAGQDHSIFLCNDNKVCTHFFSKRCTSFTFCCDNNLNNTIFLRFLSAVRMCTIS
jgi:alpha-tubulin suppressor-like RCC1 family protein